MAASDGCAEVDAYNFGTGDSLKCNGEIYIQRVPGKPDMCPDCDYSSSIDRTSTMDYALKATGFSKGEFECKNGTCYCTISGADGCIAIN